MQRLSTAFMLAIAAWTAATLLSPTTGAAPVPDQAPAGWYVGADGFAEAATSGKPLAVFVHTAWCPRCPDVKARVLPDKRVRAAIASFAAVWLDGDEPAAKPLMKQWRVRAYPDFLMLRAGGEGKPLRPVDVFDPERLALDLRRFHGTANALR